MAFSRNMLVALVLTSMSGQSQAESFLKAKEPVLISRESVEQTLDELLHSGTLRTQVETEISPMFAALPKNAHGKLEASTVRYALHRYFVQKHGWYMNGIDTSAFAWDASQDSAMMKSRAPAHLQSILEGRMHGVGLGLGELSTLAAALTALVHREATGDLLNKFELLNLSTSEPLSKTLAYSVLKTYLIFFFVGMDLGDLSIADIPGLEISLESMYPDWKDTIMWVEDLRESYDLKQQRFQNPFVQHVENADSVAAFAQEVGHEFGAYQNLECKKLKTRLVEIEYQGTGRVRLSHFYKDAIHGDWTLGESQQYLRQLGALDEADKNMPSVVIPNYLTSQTNCLTASGFYSVCCINECEGLFRRVEEEIAAPQAAPKRIAAVISNLPSDTVDAPRNLSSSLLSRLDDIARMHRGQVPLHGRLFAQWMHHTYPRECPYPHTAGSVNPLSPEDWLVQVVDATYEEMQGLVAKMDEPEGEAQPLPWVWTEELLSDDHDASRQAFMHDAMWIALRITMAVAVLVSLSVSLWRAVGSSSETKQDGMLV